jgi:nucleoside-diphosphate-sugar epimerase
MRLLVLGGTLFVSRAVAAEAVRRGHEVVCAARGQTGSLPDGAKLVVVDRDAPDGLAPLAGESFDGVVDVAKISHPWVANALDVLAENAAHWTFVSSISVYNDGVTQGQRTDASVFEPKREEVRAGQPLTDPELYGAIKVASENAVLERLGDRAFVVRPGLITGPGDISDRFGYWPGRMARGGRVLVPDAPDAPAQIVDVRDLADWIVSAAERKLVGVFDAIGPSQPLNDMLAGIAATVGADVELVKASPEALKAANVQPWMGPRSLPLWVEEEDYGLGAHDPTPSIQAGMPVRPFADAVLGALEHERALGLDRERRAGLSLAEEAEVLVTL